jgi:hypothetical protein
MLPFWLTLIIKNLAVLDWTLCIICIYLNIYTAELTLSKMTCKEHKYCALTIFWKNLKYIHKPCYVCTCVCVCVYVVCAHVCVCICASARAHTHTKSLIYLYIYIYISIIVATFRTQTNSQSLKDRHKITYLLYM